MAVARELAEADLFADIGFDFLCEDLAEIALNLNRRSFAKFYSCRVEYFRVCASRYPLRRRTRWQNIGDFSSIFARGAFYIPLKRSNWLQLEREKLQCSCGPPGEYVWNLAVSHVPRATCRELSVLLIKASYNQGVAV